MTGSVRSAVELRLIELSVDGTVDPLGAVALRLASELDGAEVFGMAGLVRELRAVLSELESKSGVVDAWDAAVALLGEPE